LNRGLGCFSKPLDAVVQDSGFRIVEQRLQTGCQLRRQSSRP
jgi:hypothetical protein